jgi:hypothetical protein
MKTVFSEYPAMVAGRAETRNRKKHPIDKTSEGQGHEQKNHTCTVRVREHITRVP